jgi:hypothetical protein
MRGGYIFLGTIVAAGLCGALSLFWKRIPVERSNAEFDRIYIGMTLPEAERLLGPSGLSYSSDTAYDYYIWKEKATWVSVIVKNGKIIETHIRPAP